MDHKDVPPVVADALNRMERRITNDLAELKAAIARIRSTVADGLAGVRHDIHLLSVKVDANHERTSEKLDRGFQQVVELLEKK